MESILEFTGLDPLLFGDGRPFSSDPGSANAHSLPMPLPSTLAGAIRWQCARENAAPQEHSQEWENRLLGVRCRGPLLKCGERYFVPIPLDAVAMAPEGKGADDVIWVPARPEPALQGVTDLPSGVQACVARAPGHEPTKAQAEGFASLDWLAANWLIPMSGQSPPPGAADLMGPLTEHRTHVGIEFGKGAAAQSMLFQTEGLCLTDVIDWGKSGEDPQWLGSRAITCAVDAGSSNLRLSTNSVLTLGGERRLAACVRSDGGFPVPPGTLNTAWKGARRTRMVLATPAMFDLGWLPSWLCKGHGLTLVGACVGRYQPVSGWDALRNRPKPVRWLAPAGSVFFFEGKPSSDLDAVWLQPVSDNEQDRYDGFGLALWGVW